MMEHDIKHIAENFNLDGKLIQYESFGSGHINDTYCLTCERDPILQKDRKMGTQQDGHQIHYIMQRINHEVFKNPPKMMENMKKGGGMMGKMMGQKGGGDGEDFSPMDMCRKMMSSMGEGQNIESFATPELRNLFNDWIQQINEEILGFVQTHQSASVEQVAEHLKLSANSVAYLFGTLAQEGKVRLTAKVMNG